MLRNNENPTKRKAKGYESFASNARQMKSERERERGEEPHLEIRIILKRCRV